MKQEPLPWIQRLFFDSLLAGRGHSSLCHSKVRLWSMANLAVSDPDETVRVLMEACGQLRHMEGSMSPSEARSVSGKDFRATLKVQIMCLF
jgi:hypothetical protein